MKLNTVLEIGTDVVTEALGAYHLPVGHSVPVPPVRFTIRGEHFRLDGTLTKEAKPEEREGA